METKNETNDKKTNDRKGRLKKRQNQGQTKERIIAQFTSNKKRLRRWDVPMHEK